MSHEEGVRIACRYVVVFLLIGAITDAIGLPRAILDLLWDIQRAGYPREGMPSGIESSVVHYLRSSILLAADLTLRTVLNLAGALWFYRCGPFLRKFFGEDAPPAASMTLDSRGSTEPMNGI